MGDKFEESKILWVSRYFSAINCSYYRNIFYICEKKFDMENISSIIIIVLGIIFLLVSFAAFKAGLDDVDRPTTFTTTIRIKFSENDETEPRQLSARTEPDNSKHIIVGQTDTQPYYYTRNNTIDTGSIDDDSSWDFSSKNFSR